MSEPSQDDDGLAEVKKLAAAGKKIEAIKVYRERTGCSLREAKAAVEALAAPPSSRGDERLAEVRELAAAGHKIEAIKVYRARTGCSLSEAKTFVDGLHTPQPEEPSANPLTSGEPLPLLMLGVVVALMFLAAWVVQSLLGS